jgi:hypothetical protein
MFAFGARAGVPLTDAFSSVKSQDFIFNSSTKRFTAGPSAELLLPFGLGLEADLLYKNTDVEIARAPGDGGELTLENDSVGVWEIPLLAKFRLPGAGLRPFVSGGGAYRNFGSLLDLAEGLKDSGWGFVVGGGLEIKVKRVRISPEIRFTRWGSGQIGDGSSTVKYNQNQADFLIGVTF